jgi:glycosyltransferase involved in cell wall biosynthesis
VNIKLVSIITPCFNADKYIHKLLNSVLDQTYAKIEMFVIDDGSTDKSADIIKSYISKFTERGYKLEYVYQKNQGQSVAINNGLKLVRGDYLLWPDADDYYAGKTTISKMVKLLELSDDKTSMVRVQYNILDEKGRIVDRLGVNEKTRYKKDLFEDAVFGTNGFWYPPGGYMAKIDKIDELVPNREIYTEKNAGQNFQLYLPLLYKQKCLTIEKYLYNIVGHGDSHSRNMITNKNRQKVYYRTIKKTLKKVPMDSSYRKYIVKKVQAMIDSNIQSYTKKKQYRTYTKKAIKALIPYGLMVLYKRKYH